MLRRCTHFLVLIAAAGAIAGCGSGSGGAATMLRIDGVVTRAGVEARLSGTITCRDRGGSGTGSLAEDADLVCRRLRSDADVFDEVGLRGDRLCTEIYGGPQEARIRGRVDGTPVDVRVARSDGCGIADWERLEWLLGPPDR